MNVTKVLKTAASAVIFAASLAVAQTASATQYPTFTLDLDQSDVTVSTPWCVGDCDLQGGFSGTGTVDVDFNSTGQIVNLSELITWQFEPNALMLGVFDLAIDLVFTSPDTQTASTSGTGLFASFYGIVSGGILSWTHAVQTVAFDQGSELALWLESGPTIALGETLTTDVYLQAETLVPLDAPSPAPVPAALPVMLLAMGGLYMVGRRQKASKGAVAA